MSRIKIEVNDGVLDLFDGTDKAFYITKQINDLHNLQNRQADYTREIKIPSTENNKELLNLETNEQLSNPSFPCNILLNESLVIPYARLLIVTHSITEISIVMFSGNYQLFDNIPNESIKDLDFSTYNFPWTVAGIDGIKATTEGAISTMVNYLDSKSLDDGLGIPTPMAAFGTVDIYNYGFSFFLKTIAKAIIENAGYVYDDSLINTDTQYNNLVLAAPVFIPSQAQNTIQGIVSNTNNWVYDNAELGLPARIDTFTIVSDPTSIWSNLNQEFTVSVAGSWTVIYDFVITYDHVVGGPAELTVKQNGGYLDSRFYSASVTNQHELIQVTFNAAVGDLIYIDVVADYRNSAQYDTVTISNGSVFTLQETVVDPTGSVVISDWLPNINQKDIFTRLP